MGQLEACELGLVRPVARQGQLFEEPVVQRAMTVELEGAQRVGRALDGIALAVRPVVGGVDDPRVARAVMMATPDAVHDGVTQLHVLVLHVDLGAQHHRAVVELARSHASEQVEVLLDGAIAAGRLDARLAVAAALGADGLEILVVDVGLAVVDEEFGPFVQLLEVVARVDDLVGLVAEPVEVGEDAFDEGGVLGVGVRVVEAEHARAAELACELEVEVDRLGVTDVEVAVRFRWEPRLDAPAEAVGVEIVLHPFAHEVGPFGGLLGDGVGVVGCHSGLQYGGRRARCGPWVRRWALPPGRVSVRGVSTR